MNFWFLQNSIITSISGVMRHVQHYRSKQHKNPLFRKSAILRVSQTFTRDILPQNPLNIIRHEKIKSDLVRLNTVTGL